MADARSKAAADVQRPKGEPEGNGDDRGKGAVKHERDRQNATSGRGRKRHFLWTKQGRRRTKKTLTREGCQIADNASRVQSPKKEGGIRLPTYKGPKAGVEIR